MLKLNGILESINEETATIITENEKKIIWPKENLPAGLNINDKICLTIDLKSETEKANGTPEINLLNEILNVKNNPSNS